MCSYGFARYETVEQAEDCIRGLVSLKYEAGFARVYDFHSTISYFILIQSSYQESFNARLKTLADPNSTNVYVSNLPRSMNEKASPPTNFFSSPTINNYDNNVGHARHLHGVYCRLKQNLKGHERQQSRGWVRAV